MKLYIDKYKFLKDRELPSYLEEEFNKLSSFYKSRCSFDSFSNKVCFAGFYNLEEKEEFIKEYQLFLKKVSEVINGEEIEDDILDSLKDEFCYIDDYYYNYVTEDGEFFYCPSFCDIPKKYRKKKLTFIYSICLKEEDINYALNNGEFPKGIICSTTLKYWIENRIELKVEQLEKLIDLCKDKDLEIVKVIFQESIAKNLYSFDKAPKLDYLENLNDAILNKIINQLNHSRDEEFLEKYNKIIFEYNTFKNEHRYIGDLRKDIINSIKDKKEVSQQEKELYVNLLEELALENDKDAISEIGYAYNEGDRFFPCDYYKAVPYLEKMGENGDYFAYNVLGYIYYYGRVNNKIPEYDKAFKYFSLGNIGGIFESTYKLGDMYKNGYYVKQNYDIAFRLYIKNFKEQLEEYLLQGDFANKLPDITLRLASCYLKGSGCEKSISNALFFVKLAKLSSIKRIKVWDFWGNMSVDKSINELYENILTEYKKENGRFTKKSNNYESSIFIGNDCLKADLKLKGKELVITITPMSSLTKYMLIDTNNHKEFYLGQTIIIKLTLKDHELNNVCNETRIINYLNIDDKYIELATKAIEYDSIKVRIIKEKE